MTLKTKLTMLTYGQETVEDFDAKMFK